MGHVIDDFGTDEKIVITKEKLTKERLPPYNLVGNGLSNRYGSSLDLIDVCVQLNLGEMRLLQYMRNMFNMNCINKEVEPNIIVPAKGEEWSSYLATALKKNYTHMVYMKLIVRISRGKYLLNPYLFMYSKGYSNIAAKWDELISKENKDEQ
jgi:hypothetical protein